MVSESESRRPRISIVVVSDYSGGDEKSWNDLRKTLRALAMQDYEGPAEFLLSESARFEPAIPPDLHEVLPSLRVALAEDETSYGLKNAGVEAATGELIAILDADCAPLSDWMRNLVAAFDRHPKAAAVSGRTTYPGGSFLERALALATRSFLDPGRAGPTRFVSNNNAGWRRSTWLEHPLPVGLGAFAARMQSESALRSGHELYFDPSVHVFHDFEGWAMEVDIRRNMGYGTVITRLQDREQPYASLTRLGRASIPLFVAGKSLEGIASCLRCWRQYGIRFYELPAALALSVVAHAMEIPGMWAAFAGRRITDTEYR